jgi:ABC-type transporter Mla MlaB component
MATSGSTTIVFAIHGPIERDDLPGLCARVCALFERTRPQVAFCELDGVGADAITADALARLQLAARRRGCQVRLRNPPADVRELIAFMGLSEVLPE